MNVNYKRKIKIDSNITSQDIIICFLGYYIGYILSNYTILYGDIIYSIYLLFTGFNVEISRNTAN